MKICFLIMLLCGLSLATNTVYVTQSGTGTQSGVDCSNTKPASYFNTVGSWSATPAGVQIGPDTTVHVTGTFTGGAGATMLTFQGDGSSGHPVIVLSDNCGGSHANFTAPYWNGGNGAIFVQGHSHVIIDGAGTGDAGAIPSTFVTAGIIQDTANGTALANQQASHGITIGSATDVIVRNWAIINIYQRSGHTTEAFDETTAECVNWTTSANQITITNNLMHDGGWCLNGNGDNITWSHNDMYNFEHSIIGAPAHFWMFNNHLHDWAIWDAPCPSPCGYHHDGLHCFAGSGGNTSAAYIYNNQFDGATSDGNVNDGKMNQFIYIEGNGSATTCMLPGGTVWIFNNVAIGDSTFSAIWAIYGNSTTGDSGDYWVNNTSIGLTNSDGTNSENFQQTSTATIANNALGGTGILVGGSGTLAFSLFDYNAYENCNTGNCFFIGSIDTGSFTTWKASSIGGVSPDAHGTANLASSTYFKLNSACVPGSLSASCAPLLGSPLIGAGTNLFSACNGQANPGLGALCFDKAGLARPSSGAWDIGAYQFAGSANSLGAPAAWFMASR